MFGDVVKLNDSKNTATRTIAFGMIFIAFPSVFGSFVESTSARIFPFNRRDDKSNGAVFIDPPSGVEV
jgi:hypothetical protein